MSDDRRAMISRLTDRRLYIADLLARLAAMEWGHAPMNPLAYRVLSKRLRQAAAGFPASALAGGFGPFDPLLAEVLDNRHFAGHGQLSGRNAARCQAAAAALFRRLHVRPLRLATLRRAPDQGPLTPRLPEALPPDGG